jgi:hypothetical protein
MLQQQGVLRGTLYDSGRLSDADFTKAIKAGRAGGLLARLFPLQHTVNRNLNFHNFVPWSFYAAAWSGATAPGEPYYRTQGAGYAWLGFICLLTYDTEPTYTESSNEGSGGTAHNVAGTVNNSNAAKRIVNDQIEAYSVWSAGDGRNEVLFRNRWLYLPSEVVSSTINSLGVYYYEDATYALASTGRYKGRSARVRFKDSGGNPITITKTTNQVFLLEYTWSMVSL